MRASTRKKIEKTYLAQQAKAEAKAKAKAKAKSKKPATKTVSWDKADSINNEQVVPSNFRNAVVLTMDGEDARDETPLGVKYPDRAFPQSDVVENEREETARDDAITKASSLDINQNFSALGASDILNNMQDAASDQVGIADTRQPRSQSKPKADDVSHRATKENSTLARAKQGIKSEQGGTHAGGLRYGHSKSKKTTEANKIREGENFQDSIVSTSMEEDMSGEREGCQQRKDTNQEMIHTVREAVARRTRTKVKNLSPGNDFSRNRNKGNQRCKGFFGKRKSQSKRGHAARELGLASEKAKREKEQNEQEVEILATLTMKSEEEESPNSVELADKEGKVDSKDDSENPPALSSNKESSSIAGGGPLADCFLHMMPEVDWLKMFFGGVHTATKRGSPAEATTVPVGVAEGQEPTLAKSSPFFPRQSPQSGTHAVSVKTNNNRQGRRTSDTRPAPRSPSPGTARRRKSPARKASPSRKQEVASTRGRSPSQRSKRPSPSAKDKSTSRLESGSRSGKYSSFIFVLQRGKLNVNLRS